MRESKGDTRFGIFLKEDNLKLIEIEDSLSHQFRINRIVQTNLETSLNFNSLQNDHQVMEIGEQIKEIFEMFNFRVKNGIFTLESPFALIKKLPIDGWLKETELIDQIDWEVKQFSFSPDDEYIVDFERLNVSRNDSVQEIVIVSVREKVIYQLKKLFNAGKLSIGVIDLDIFAAIRAVAVNYDLKPNETHAIIEVDSSDLKFTILKEKEFYDYRELPLAKTGLSVESFAYVDENEILDIISKELKRFIVDIKVGNSIENLHRLFLHGSCVTDNLLENLQNNFNVRIDKVNPFRKLYIAPKVSVDEKIWSHPETFTVCVGSALRSRES